jgi:large subunit ribosomal protein L4
MTIQKLIKYNSFTINGQKLSDQTQELKLRVLEKSGNYFIHQDFLRHRTAQNQGTKSTKTRSEVRGGGRKPWKQKGTGRARAGSNCSPLWKGGGVIFGPKPKKNILKLNKKERRLALQTLLYNKKNTIRILKDLETNTFEPKTKNFLRICTNCLIDPNENILIIVSKKTEFLKFATQNLPKIELISASHLNTYSLLKAEQIILTPEAINYIKGNYIKEIYCE